MADIIAMARARNVDVILDSAQAIGQMPFKVAEYGADFIGFSLHKWVGSPLGTGAIYIRKERQRDILPWADLPVCSDQDIRASFPTNRIDIAPRLTIAAAVELQNRIGLGRKFGHLRALRDHWVSRAREVSGVELMLPVEPDNYGAISAFRFPGMHTLEQARAAQARLVGKHKLLVMAKAGLKSGPVLRVTPALFSTSEELDRLVTAIAAERRLFS